MTYISSLSAIHDAEGGGGVVICTVVTNEQEETNYSRLRDSPKHPSVGESFR